MSNLSYDVVIGGCGTAGVFSALELVQKTSLHVLMIDRGPDLDQRSVKKLECPRHYFSGWAGAGAFSDEKLTMSSAIGGLLSDYVPRSEMERLTKLYSSRTELSSTLETKIRNLFAVGDGAGVTRGLMQASVSGVIAATEVAKREGFT